MFKVLENRVRMN